MKEESPWPCMVVGGSCLGANVLLLLNVFLPRDVTRESACRGINSDVCTYHSIIRSLPSFRVVCSTSTPETT